MVNRQGVSARRQTKLADAGFDRDEETLLHMARRFFLSYAQPPHPHWESAIDIAMEHFGAEHGPGIAVTLMNTLRAMRTARKTTFRFINPCCAQCAAKLTDCERLLIRTIRFVRVGENSSAQTEALMLCEGFDSGPLLKAIRELDARLTVCGR